jgi:phage terminase small subunit
MELQEVHRIENLDPPEQQILDDLLTTMPAGVLCSMDTPLIQMCMDQHRYYRRAMKSLNKDPYSAVKRNAMVAAREGYLKLARELGLTPNARAAMKAPVTAASEDPFLDVIARQAR